MHNLEPDDIARLDARYAEAEELADRIMLVVGLTPDQHDAWIGKIKVGVIGAAIGIAAGRITSALSDESFGTWLVSIVAERLRTRAHRLTEQ